ncbi:tyrosine-type recombinase/integrase [Stenotrophomonas sp. GD03930]|jgi:integrase|uniref:tyrosine-type recombinase/integrase n=1 Tax=Stenotrophomonas sp. GD03930 TaxID=2975406 RepID=UPI00244A036C|nr:tyrosine-type recombinase/integrase [Stenotrophomonas sp. GD03930]MDH1230430.1 tyrosine-type recombinase/integrase [Stenotrophomonas sp. GD03930]
MAAGYRVKTVRFESGERLPMLLCKESGSPLWHPNLFLVTELRAVGLATNTLEHAARAVMIGHQVFRHLGIDIHDRINDGRLFTLGEVELLTKLVGLRQEELDALSQMDESPRAVVSRVVTLEQARMRPTVKAPAQVGADTKATRMAYIRDYISWLTAGRRLKLEVGHPHNHSLLEATQTFVSLINARMPSRHSAQASRQGVDAEVRARILEVIDPDSADNPWKNRHVRVRNQLIFLWLLLLGVRNGELLATYASDVNIRTGEVTIVRRPGNPEEPRKSAPLVKTRGRLLALSPDLAKLIQSYIMGERAKIKGARRHPYLFVATGTGQPLSKPALNKLFRELRSKVPGLPDDLSPHVLRHTWNDDFSDLMDSRGVSAEDEERMRTQTMGWSPRSKMASHYTKRHVQRKSNDASLEMQAKSFSRPVRKSR